MESRRLSSGHTWSLRALVVAIGQRPATEGNRDRCRPRRGEPGDGFARPSRPSTPNWKGYGPRSPPVRPTKPPRSTEHCEVYSNSLRPSSHSSRTTASATADRPARPAIAEDSSSVVPAPSSSQVVEEASVPGSAAAITSPNASTGDDLRPKDSWSMAAFAPSIR